MGRHVGVQAEDLSWLRNAAMDPDREEPGQASTVDYAASWSSDFIVALFPWDVPTAACPVPKSQMINFPMQVARPTTTKPIVMTIPMPSQLSDVENIAIPLRSTD
jgi:hypothetical protein